MGFKAISTSRSAATTAVSKQATVINSSSGFAVTGSTITANTVISLNVNTPGQASNTTTAGLSISSVNYLYANNVISPANAVSTAGGNIKINGAGFSSPMTVVVGGTTVANANITVANSTAIIAALPSASPGNVNLYTFNSGGTGAQLVNGVYYSGAPTWTTTSVTFQNGAVSNVQLVASSDSTLTYTLQAGSSLPTGINLISTGYLSGTATGYSNNTTSTAVIVATDLENQATQQTITWTVSVADPQFNYTTVLLNGDTGNNIANNATNNTFVDSSTNNFTFTRNGNSTQGSFTPFSQTGWSNFFNGTSDYLTWVPTTSGQFGTGDFTVECWIYPTSTPTTQYLVDMRTAAATTGWFFAFGAVSSGKLSWSYSAFSVTEATASVVANNWNHVAYSRASGTGRLFVNGVLANSAADSNNYANNNATAYIASRYDVNVTVNPSTFPGYISNLRMIKGTGLYTANFTVPTTPLTAVSGTSLLTCQSYRFADSSTNNYAITLVSTAKVLAYSPFAPSITYSASVVGGSGYFDGTGDNITTADNAALNLSTGNWTIEGWCYVTGGSGYRTFITKRNGTNAQYEVGINPSSYLYFYTSTVYASSTLVSNNAWHHWAATYDGSNLRLFLNGVVVLTQASVTAATGTDPIFVGSTYTAGSQFLPGYLSSVRILKGTALYTANFTPPTAPLTAVANTSLLLNFTNGGIVDAHSTVNAETIGNAKLSTAVTKFGTASMVFTAAGDFLAFQSGPNPNFAMGSGDWTIEMWMYPTSSAAAQVFFDVYDANSAGRLALQLNTNGTIGLYGASLASRTVTTGTVTLNTWQHIAFCKSSGNTRIFINGVQSNTTYVDSITYTCTAGVIYIAQNGAGGNTFLGYIDDFRVTKGFARYTANFTPPTLTFQGQ